MIPDHNGVATFRIGKRRWASWPLYAGSRAPSQASRSSLLTLTPVRTHTATHVPFCITTLRPRLHRCSTRHQLFLAEISTVAVYFPCAFTTCLRPRGYPRRPGRMEMGLWCLPSLISPPFRVRHLTYATSCRTNGLQWKWLRTAINGNLGPDYLHLSIPSGPDYVPLRLLLSSWDCHQQRWDHITCDYPEPPSSACLDARGSTGISQERLGGVPVSYISRPGAERVSLHLKLPY